MAKHNELGEKGELLAEDYLKKIGLEVLESHMPPH